MVLSNINTPIKFFFQKQLSNNWLPFSTFEIIISRKELSFLEYFPCPEILPLDERTAQHGLSSKTICLLNEAQKS